MQKCNGGGVDESCGLRGAASGSSSVVSSTLGHRHSNQPRDLCHDHHQRHHHHHHPREDSATSTERYYTELMRIKHEELSPQSGLCCISLSVCLCLSSPSSVLADVH